LTIEEGQSEILALYGIKLVKEDKDLTKFEWDI